MQLLNDTSPIVYAGRQILLNITETADSVVRGAAYENATTILIYLAGRNESVIPIVKNITRASNDSLWLIEFRKAVSISDSNRIIMQISFAAGYVYMLLAVIGVFLNTGVLIQLAKLAYTDYDRFQTGCGLPLAAMSASDLISLISIIVTVMLSTFFRPTYFPSWARSMHCKVTMYLIHAMTGFSTWCWLFVSALRYMAVYHPLWHSSRWQLGQGALFSLFAIILIMNSWLLYSVVGMHYTCGERPLLSTVDLNRVIHGVQMFLSYIVPAIITFGLDVRVLITRPPNFHVNKTCSNDRVAERNSSSFRKHRSCKPSKLLCCVRSAVRTESMENGRSAEHNSYTSLANENYSQKERQGEQKVSKMSSQSKQSVYRAHTAVLRWLMITTIDLLLNAPDNFLRIASIMSTSNKSHSSSASYHVIALIARLLYFAQFCFNALYLSTLVYKRNVESSKSRQQRLRQARDVARCQVTDFTTANGVRLRRRFSAELICGSEKRTPALDNNATVTSSTALVRAPSLPTLTEDMTTKIPPMVIRDELPSETASIFQRLDL